MATATLSPEQLAYLETPEFKKFAADFQKSQGAAIRNIKTKGYSFSDGSHLSYLELVVFVQSSLGLTADNSPAVVWDAVNAARKALGTLMPAKNKWRGLQALVDEVVGK
jgi:hypothetical protein